MKTKQLTPLRRQRWSPLAIVAMPALLVLALDAGPARAGPPKQTPKAGGKPAATAEPAVKPSKTSTLNQIDGLTIEELDDGTTSLRLEGSKVATFNVYRLPDPDRLVVDISASERGKAVPHVDVDSWAVGRVSISSISEQDSPLTRVVVQLKREASYIVVPKRNELVITITPKDIAPEAYFKRKSAGKRKAEIETMKAEAEELRADAETMKADAETIRADAESRAKTAKADADAAEKAAKAAKADADAVRKQAAQDAKDIEADATTTLSEARRLADARKKALEAADEEAKAAEARAKAAKAEAAKAEQEAEDARALAAAAKADAESLRDSAAELLAEAEATRKSAEKLHEEAEEERDRAKADAAKVRKEAEAARKSAAKLHDEAEDIREQAEADAKKTRKAAKSDADKTRKAAKDDADKTREDAEQAAEELLADAERMVEDARAEQEQAKLAHDDAKLALGEARKAKRNKTGKGEGEREALTRALEQAEQAADAAKKREKEAGERIAALESDRDRLAQLLEGERSELEALRQTVQQDKAELEEARREVADARVAYRAYGGDEGPEDGHKREHRRAKQGLHRAENELAKLEDEAETQRDELAELQTKLSVAEEQLAATLDSARESTSLTRQWERERKLAGASTIKDVRFEDGPKGARVVVELDGPVVYDASSLTPNMTMLEIRDTDIPVGLERSLDTTSFRGPIDRITSFREGDDVKIVVASASAEPAKLELDGNRLIWTFPKVAAREQTVARYEGEPREGEDALEDEIPEEPRAAKRTEVVSLAGTKVSGFSTPPVMAARPTNVGARTRWRGERIDIELQDAPIKDVLLLFSDIGRVNIIAGPEVQGTVTMKLSSVPWDQALDIILRSLQLGMVQEGNVIRVATQAELEEEQRKAIEQANAQVQLKPLETRLVPLSYATVDDMLPKVQSVLSSRGTVTPDTRTNTLIVMDVAENIALAESLVRQLDSQTPQVLIEARIVEARTNWLRQLGIQWGLDFTASPGTGNPTGLLFPNSVGIGGGSGSNLSPTRGLILPGAAANPHYAVDLPATVGTGTGGALGFSFGSLSGNLNTNLRLSAAEEEGEVRIISAPKIVTLDNTEAQIEQGVQIPISQVSAQGVNTRYVNATLGLQVTPHVTNEGAVLLEVQVQKNEADFVNTGARGDPTILTKSAESQLLITDGDTAVIGGIYTRNQAVNFSQVPWFADIPIFGWFFKNKVERDDRSEMLIFLTPRIVNRSTSIGGDAGEG
jgi:type IV pilus assembly protein PilQ